MAAFSTPEVTGDESPKVYKLEVDLTLSKNYNTVSEICQDGDIPLSILMQ